MAKKRCINVDFFESEKFVLLNDKSKVLYIGLLLHCDDDGFILNPKTVMRLHKKNIKYFNELVENGFILQVDDVFVITHWNVHNTIQPSKKIPTIYQKELMQLGMNFRKEYIKKAENFRKISGLSAD